MDDIKRRKQLHRRPAAIDGFVSKSPRQGALPPQGSLGSLSNRQFSGLSSNFKSVDGFHPSSRSPLRTTARPVGRQPRRDEMGRISLDLPATTTVRKKRRHYGKASLKAFSMLMIVSVLIAGFLFGKGYLKARQIFKGGGGAAALQDNVDPSKLRGEGDGRVNILLLGKGGLGHDGPDLTDTILIASISPAQKEAALLSIPRDFYVKVNGSYTKINAVYADAKYAELNRLSSKDSSRDQKAEDAGLKAIENTIQSTIGIPIHYHVMVDFAGFKEAIDTVGGIDMNVPTELAVTEHMYIEGFGNYYLNVPAGQQHFDGFRALAFSRTRHTSARGDFDRSERQRMVLVALKSKVFTAGTYGNPFKINQLINNFGNHIQANMTTDEVMRLYDIGKSIDSSKIASVDLVTPPNDYLTTANVNGLSVVEPKAGLGNYKDIQSFVRNRLKDGFLAEENASIAIFNGTDTPGLAARTAQDLKSYGYNVTQVADAPTKGYGQTVVIDMRNGAKKYTKHYLENRFSVDSVSNLPDKSVNPGNADFVIILGQNETSRLDNQ